MIPEYTRRMLYLTGKHDEWGQDYGMALFDHLEEVGGYRQELFERLMMEFKGKSMTSPEIKDAMGIREAYVWTLLRNEWIKWEVLRRTKKKVRGYHYYKICSPSPKRLPPLKSQEL